jgi:integrase
VAPLLTGVWPHERSETAHGNRPQAHGISLARRFQKILKDAELPRQRFHDLRHAAASLRLAQGVNPRVVMEILGHSQISLTLNTYSQIPSLQREAVSRMDAVLG